MAKWRLYSKENYVKAMYFHWARAEWLKRQKKKEDATKHSEKFETLFKEASLNERSTFDFIRQASGAPTLPDVRGYEACPIEPMTHGQASIWFITQEGIEPGVQINLKLPTVLYDPVAEIAQVNESSMTEVVRDLIAVALRVQKPADNRAQS